MRTKMSVGEAHAILASMRDVAATGSSLTAADRASLVSTARWMFDLPALDVDGLDPVSPAALAAALRSRPDLREEAVRFLSIMAFIDGTLDVAKLDRVTTYAAALGISGAFVEEIRDAAHGQVKNALAHMVRDNMASVTGRPWPDGPELDAKVMAWMLPYRDTPNHVLAARFHALAVLPDGSFGRAFFDHFASNGYAFPGEVEALNAEFSLPHDSSHVFAGYDTTPHGELLVSTFTAGMHPVYPMSGHILPVIFSWHLGAQINDVAKSATGALDPREFWHAWARGRNMKMDIFGAEWNFWAWLETPLDELRRRWLGE